MITSFGTIRWSVTTGIFLISSLAGSQFAQAGENQLRQADQRVRTSHARLAKSKTSTPTKRKSLVAQAAQGRVSGDLPEAPLDGTLVSGDVRQVGFFGGCTGNCGPVCDCCDASCGAEPICGVEEIYADPGCGIEVGCGVEAGCGFEVGCGIGAAIESLGPPACGVEGCLGCGEMGCGVETIYEGPGCGIEPCCDSGCDSCASACGVSSIPLFVPLLRINWCRFDFFAGVQGFKGPMNFANTNPANANVRDGSGSFGFYEGFNEGRSLKRWLGWDMASQLGVRATQSNLSGSNFTNENRNQIFVTAGLFRRVDYGLQYGLVFDYLNDDWWFHGDSTQLRGELSWKTAQCHVFGFQFMGGLGSETTTTAVLDNAGTIVNSTVTFEPTDQYRLFYRRLLNHGGDWSGFLGYTDNDDGLLGASMNMPLRRKLLLSSGVTYLIPNEGAGNNGNQEEGWNISLGLVYRPGGPEGSGRYSRPMFDVADNGTFMVDQR